MSTVYMIEKEKSYSSIYTLYSVLSAIVWVTQTKNTSSLQSFGGHILSLKKNLHFSAPPHLR